MPSIATTTRTIHYVRNPRGISAQTSYYALTASSTAPTSKITVSSSGVPTIPSIWKTADQQVTAAKPYKWRQILTKYTDNTYSVSIPVCIAVYAAPGATGATGAMGPKVRYLKWQDIMAKMRANSDYTFDFLSGNDSYDSPVTAAENIQYYDIVWYDDGTAHNWYLCKKGYQASSSSSTPISDTDHWQSSTTNMGFIATDVFFASRAYVRNLAADDIYIQDDDGNVIVELNSERQVMRGNVIANTLTLGAKALKTYNKTQLAAAFSGLDSSASDAAFGQALAAADLSAASLDNLAYADDKCINKAFQWKGAGYGFHWLPALDPGTTKVCEVMFFSKSANYEPVTVAADGTATVNVPVIFCGTTKHVYVGSGGKLNKYQRLLRLPLYTGRYRFAGFSMEGDYAYWDGNSRWAKAVETDEDGNRNYDRMRWVDANDTYPQYSSYKGKVYAHAAGYEHYMPDNAALALCNTEGSAYTTLCNTYWCLSADLDETDAAQKLATPETVTHGSNDYGVNDIYLEAFEDRGSTQGRPKYIQSML